MLVTAAIPALAPVTVVVATCRYPNNGVPALVAAALPTLTPTVVIVAATLPTLAPTIIVDDMYFAHLQNIEQK